ncbi:MAG: STAS domain-containing protein [Proteobacteria bacterium]|nr:STAS domain-containing protein [Pseudomonadota bacterium]
MKYHITKEDGFCLIKISGDTRKNEAIQAKEVLSPYLKEEGIKIIVDLQELEKFEPANLFGVLNSIKKEVHLLRGDIKLCSLNSKILNYLKQNRMDHFFQICEDIETAKKSEFNKRAGK